MSDGQFWAIPVPPAQNVTGFSSPVVPATGIIIEVNQSVTTTNVINALNSTLNNARVNTTTNNLELKNASTGQFNTIETVGSSGQEQLGILQQEP